MKQTRKNAAAPGRKKTTADSQNIGAPGGVVDHGDKEYVSPVVEAARNGEEVTVVMDTAESETVDD